MSSYGSGTYGAGVYAGITSFDWDNGIEFVPDTLLRVQLQLGGRWTTVTPDVSLADGNGIEIGDGRPDEASKVDAGSCGLVFYNPAGDYCRTNPLGRWSGLLKKNNPLRVQVRRPASDIDEVFNRTTSGTWGGIGWPYLEAGVGGTVAGADWSVTPGAAVHSVPAATAYRYSRLTTAQVDADAVTTVTVAMPTGGNVEPAGIMLRAQNSANYYLCRATIAPGGTVTAEIRKVIASADTLIASAAVPGLVHAAATPLNVRAQIVDSTLRLRAWQGTNDDEPAEWHATGVDSSITAAGTVGIRSGVGVSNSNSKPLLFTYSRLIVRDWRTLFDGRVPEWPPRWDKSGKIKTVPIKAAGIIRELTQGETPLHSPGWRKTVTEGPLAFWPLEDLENSTQAASALVGGSPMLLSGDSGFDILEFGKGDGLVGAPNILRLANGGGTLTGPVSGAGTVRWGVEFTVRFKADSWAGGTRNIFSLLCGTPGSLVRWDFFVTGTQYSIRPTNAAGTVLAAANGLYNLYDGRYHHMQLDFDYDAGAGEVNVFSNLDGPLSGLPSLGNFYSGETLAPVTQVIINPFGETGEDMPDIGYFAVFPGETPLTTTAPHFGYPGELASVRIARLLGEEGIPAAIVPGASEPLGPQSTDTLLKLLREGEEADIGLLYERNGGFGYQPRSQRYVAPVDLVLDRLQGHLAESPEPTDDDQRLRNDVTAERTKGSSARYQATGDFAPEVIGTFDEKVTVNVATDDVLLQHAGWLVHLGTQDDLRWPSISLNFQGRPTLIDQWLNCRIGSRLTVDNPPDGVGPDQLDLFLEGRNQRLAWREWTAEVACSPARPWKVFELDAGDNEGRLDTDGSELVLGVNETATSLSVATTNPASPLWTTTASRPGDFPFDLNIDRERITVTAITGSSSPQTFAVTRSVNGVVKAHAAGAEVELWQPYVTAR